MALDQEQIDELKSCYPEIAAAEDGGTEFILIRNLKLPKGCDPQVVDALLCPTLRDNYTSRLFLSSKVKHSGPAQNWNAVNVVIVNRNWWAVSWNTNADNLRLLGMVTAHLQAFK